MIGTHSLVLYKREPALVTAKDDKFTIEYRAQGKKETQRVREKDIIPLHPGPLESLDKALAFARKFADQRDTPARLEEAYELLAVDGESLTVPLAEIAELAFGPVSAESAWAYYEAVRLCPLFAEIPDAGGFTLRTRDQAARLREKEAGKEKDEETRRAFIGRLKAGTLDLPGDAQFMQEVEAAALGQAAKSRVMTDAGIPVEPAKAHKLLLDTGVWTRYRNPYPARWGLSSRSNRESLCKPPEEERIVLDHTAFAIDNAWSNDPDDAVFFDGEYLWVHIADPASVVTPDSAIDLAARARGSTLYLPEGAARMLSEESLEDYALGLSPVSRALSFKITLNAQGGVEDCATLKTLVKVQRRTYQEADARRDEPEFAPLFEIARKNSRRRELAGALNIVLPEVHIAARDGEVSIERVAGTAAQDMVREMMLLAGEGAARFAFKNKIPFPYASQDAPELPTDIPDGLAGQFCMVKTMHPRSIGTIPAPHSGLGLAMYSQVTSPLRRYGDLVAHQQLRAFIDRGPLLDTAAVLERISQGDAAAVAATRAERETNLHWTLVYLLEHPDWTGEAVVVELRGYQATVLIPALARQTTLITSRKPNLNDTLTVKAGKINLPELSFTFVEV
ncbi:MAG: RNB domain-containing ribonuclease [Treponema sp.]|jgi:exoribonuclease-2|nr:RNB domain-containing ribonuclease [Treponema sp.]